MKLVLLATAIGLASSSAHAFDLGDVQSGLNTAQATHDTASTAQSTADSAKNGANPLDTAQGGINTARGAENVVDRASR